MFNIGLVIVVLAVLAQTTEQASQTKKAIQKSYNEASSATIHKNVGGALAHFAPDFVGVTKGGRTIDAKQNAQNVSRLFANAKNITGTTVIKRIVIIGKSAKLRVQDHAEMTLINPRGGQPLKLIHDGISEDVWVKTPKGWAEIRSKELQVRETINGEPLPEH